MKFLAALVMLALLAACGVDGAPQPPATPGMSVSGTLRVGIGSDGG
jgi:hypothetical protein